MGTLVQDASLRGGNASQIFNISPHYAETLKNFWQHYSMGSQFTKC